MHLVMHLLLGLFLLKHPKQITHCSVASGIMLIPAFATEVSNCGTWLLPTLLNAAEILPVKKLPHAPSLGELSDKVAAVHAIC